MVPLPLFGALPGGVELLIVFFVFVLIFALLIPIGMAYWVYRDAESRGDDDATLWALATVVAGVFTTPLGAGAVLILYLLVGRE